MSDGKRSVLVALLSGLVGVLLTISVMVVRDRLGLEARTAVSQEQIINLKRQAESHVTYSEFKELKDDVREIKKTMAEVQSQVAVLVDRSRQRERKN